MAQLSKLMGSQLLSVRKRSLKFMSKCLMNTTGRALGVMLLSAGLSQLCPS